MTAKCVDATQRPKPTVCCSKLLTIELTIVDHSYDRVIKTLRCFATLGD